MDFAEELIILVSWVSKSLSLATAFDDDPPLISWSIINRLMETFTPLLVS